MALSKLSQRKIQTIEDAASSLFQSHGYHRVTMDEISEQAHVSKATLYKYFSNKQALYEQIFQNNYLREYTQIMEVIESNKSFTDKIHQVIQIRLQKYIDHSLIVYQKEFLFSEQMHQFIVEHTEHMEQARTKLYRQGRDEGCIRKDLTDETLQMYFKVIQDGLKSTFMDFRSLHDEEIISLINVLYAGVLQCPNKKS